MQKQSTNRMDVADIFDSIASQMRNDREKLNDLDRVEGNGNHGDNALHNFELVSQTLRSNQGQGDVGDRLRAAAQRLQQNGRGATANMYAQGLTQAAQKLQGRQGIGLDDIMPLLQGLLGGVQQSTNAQPGQGTLLDSLLPGIMGYMGARSSGRSNSDAIMDALGAAMRGSNQTYNQPSMFGSSRRSGRQPYRDPGAASANSMLEGLFRSITGLG